MNPSMNEPGLWAKPETLRVSSRDTIWGIGFASISAEIFATLLEELPRTPMEYIRNGAGYWYPTAEEFAERLKVDARDVRIWLRDGIDEPWEIAVVRAYARTGMVLPVVDHVPAEVVREALSRCPALNVASRHTGIPVPMLKRHLEHGAPGGTHGRAYLLMASEDYRMATGCRVCRPVDEQILATIERMVAEGATQQQIGDELNLSPSAVQKRIVAMGLVMARKRRGGKAIKGEGAFEGIVGGRDNWGDYLLPVLIRFREQGVSWERIGKHYEVSTAAVQRKAKKLGIK
jgi:hypothetical protein